METLLTIPEELFLLTVNPQTGRKITIPSRKFDILLASSILMELALQNRIDTDLEHLIPDLPGLTGNPVLDQALDPIQTHGKLENISHWVIYLAGRAPELREELITELCRKGLLRMEKEKVFLGFTTRTYPVMIRNREITEVRTRIRELVSGDFLPDVRDLVIVSLAWYGGLLEFILTPDEILLRRARIEQLARMDLIGQQISDAFRRLNLAVTAAIRAREILGIKSPEEKIEELIEEMKMVMQVDRDEDLPMWLRKGTAQYQKTLDYIRETGTKEIVFNGRTGEYGLKIWAFPGG